MENIFKRLRFWVRAAFQFKYHCSVYYKNEKIFSCKNCNEAEEHIKRMYKTVSDDIGNTHKNTTTHAEETSRWKKFRNSFNITND